MTGWADVLFPSINNPFGEDDVLNWFCKAWVVIRAAVAAAIAVFFTSSNDVDALLITSGDIIVICNALSIECSTRV